MIAYLNLYNGTSWIKSYTKTMKTHKIFAIPHCIARTETRTPFSCLDMIYFFTSIVVLTTFLFALLLSLSSSGPMVAYLITIYKKQRTLRKSRKGTANSSRRLHWAGLRRNWRSPAVHLTYLVANLPAREPVRSLFWFHVWEPICSRWESFDNGGSIVIRFM
jgi:hypothetical protein